MGAHRIKYTKESFLAKYGSTPEHQGYTYEKTKYVNYNTKFIVTCHNKDENGKEHGDFEITPLHFADGQGCPKCRRIKAANKLRRNIDDVIKEANIVHHEKYDYSLIKDYKNDRIKYPIICPEHGVFYQTMNSHIKAKQGCPECGKKASALHRRLTVEKVIEKANQVHGGKYSYEHMRYETEDSKVRITCPVHGDFTQLIKNHLHLNAGCPKCNYAHSKGELNLYNYLVSLLGEDSAIPHDRSAMGNKDELDIYIPSKKFAIEYDGLYWHSERTKPDKNYHLNKTIDCEDKGIRLFHIFEDEWKYKQDIVKSMLSNILGLAFRRIYARNCIIKEVDSKTASIFLDANHLQGKCGSTTRLGLYYNDELVSLMTFGKSRHFVGNNNDDTIELLRFCNKLNTVVVGGASKLFKHYVNENKPKRIVSYADRRWSVGGLYNKLGFHLYNKSKPNYYYVINNKRVYRYNMRKSILVGNYGCPSDMSEHEFCLSKKWYRIYDCGCLCYEFVSKQNNA